MFFHHGNNKFVFSQLLLPLVGSDAKKLGNYYAFIVHGCTIAAILIMMLSEL